MKPFHTFFKINSVFQQGKRTIELLLGRQHIGYYATETVYINIIYKFIPVNNVKKMDKYC